MSSSVGPSIVSTGLVLSLDAGNSASLSNVNSNLLTSAENFTAATWLPLSSSTVAANTAIAPDGTLTADVITSVNDAGVYQQNTIPTNTTYTASVYLKLGGGTATSVMFRDMNGASPTGFHVVINTTNGTMTGSSVLSFGSVDAGNNWRRFWFTYIPDTTSSQLAVRPNSQTGTTTYTIWGAQLEYGSSLTTYFPVNASSQPSTTWNDLSGNANNGTLANAPTYSSGSLVMKGINQYATVVSTSGFLDINTNSLFADVGYAWTVNAWFKFPVAPSGTRTGNAAFVILGKSGGIGGAETLTVFVGSGTDATYGSYVPYYLAVGIRGTKTIISTAPVNTGIWNNVSVTWNGTAGRMYLNGADMGATNIGTAAIQTGYYLGVGVTGLSTTTTTDSIMQFEGNISYASAYSRALSAQEVQQNYNALRGRYSI